jgi:DNA-directed RNA polymerase specialized sigma24 family protein
MRWQTGCVTTLRTANAKRHRRPTRSSPSALGRLTHDDRELLTLVAWDGLRADQAAAVLGISAAAARQRLVRARRRLRAELDTAPDATTGNDGPPTFTPTDTWPRSALKR